MNLSFGLKAAAGAVLLLVLILGGSSATYVVEPGNRGILVTLGRVSPSFRSEGIGLKVPFISRLEQQTVRQQTERTQASCYSSDLQQVEIDVKVLFRIPEGSVVELYRDYEGRVFQALIEPRVAEALKEVTALRRAEDIVQQREDVKRETLDSAREKIGEFLRIEDVVLEDIRLTEVLESSIEAKMVQEQEAARARFAQQQAEVEAETKVIEAKGEAEAIRLQGEALRKNPAVLDLQVVEQWDGVTPLVVGPDQRGTEVILPMGTRPGETSKPGDIE